MAAAVNAPVSVMKTAGEGGAWGMAILAAYMLDKAEDETLDTYLSDKVFAGEEGTTIDPDEKDVEGFDEFIKQYQKVLHLNELQLMSCKKETKMLEQLKKKSMKQIWNFLKEV